MQMIYIGKDNRKTLCHKNPHIAIDIMQSQCQRLFGVCPLEWVRYRELKCNLNKNYV